MVLVLLCTSLDSLLAQNREWQYIEEFENVSFYWRYREEMNGQYITEMKVVNENGSKVEVSFRPLFRCDGAYIDNQGNPSINIQANSKKSGEFSGLFWYPCKSKQPPTNCKLKNVVVRRI